jgi:4-hydroxybenzoate polyprenyltransferase
MIDTAKAILVSMRPQQWIRNLMVFAGYLFSLADRPFILSTELQLLQKTAAAFIVFCLFSGAVYIFNDLFDRAADRTHPHKKDRPIASGKLPVGIAWIVFFILALCSSILGLLLNMAFGILGVIYMLMFMAYTLVLKRIIILDAIIIAMGFVFRAVAGALIIDVGISIWLIICTIFLALFLGFAKRRAELQSLGDNASAFRSSLADYSDSLLTSLIGICSSLAIVCYTMYTMSERSFEHVGPDSLLTLPFVIFGIFRYLFLISRDDRGYDPAQVLFSDFPLLLSTGLWIIVWFYLLVARPGILSSVIIL